MRKWRIVLVAIAVVLIVAAASGFVVFKRAHPRDEPGYLAYLVKYDGLDGRGLDPIPDHGEVIRAGDDSCHWLAGQPIAAWRTSQQYRFAGLLRRYTDEVGDQSLPWAGMPGRTAVAVAAWNYLCPGVWAVHKPRYLFSNSVGDD